jgi:hypothetical protein
VDWAGAGRGKEQGERVTAALQRGGEGQEAAEGAVAAWEPLRKVGVWVGVGGQRRIPTTVMHVTCDVFACRHTHTRQKQKPATHTHISHLPTCP